LFVGEYQHAVDDKGRVVLPASYRAAIADRGYVANIGECVALWDAVGFERISERWREALRSGELDMRTFRLLSTSVNEVRLDSAGRITIPRPLLDELGFGREVRIAGMLDRIELWDERRYLDAHDRSADGPLVAQKMNELGTL
jgi:MraZ protein